MFPVIERHDVVEQVGLSLGACTVARAVYPLILKLLKKRSVGALSRQLPLRLIEQTMPYAFSRA